MGSNNRITVDFDDRIIVSNWGHNYTFFFTSDGTFISKFGGPEVLDGPFTSRVSREGRIFIADGSHGVQSLSPL